MIVYTRSLFSLIFILNVFTILVQSIAPKNKDKKTFVFNPPSDEWLRANCRKFGYKCKDKFVSYDRSLVGQRFPAQFPGEVDITERVNVGGLDGHCGFRTLSLALTGTEANYLAVKADLLKYMERMALDETISPEDKQRIREGIAGARLKFMAPYHWVNNVAAARLYKLNILSCVHADGEKPPVHRWELNNPIEKTINWYHREQLAEYPSVYTLNRNIHAQVITNPWPGELRSPLEPLLDELQQIQNFFQGNNGPTKHQKNRTRKNKRGEQGEQPEQFQALLYYAVIFIIIVFMLFFGGGK